MYEQISTLLQVLISAYYNEQEPHFLILVCTRIRVCTFPAIGRHRVECYIRRLQQKIRNAFICVIKKILMHKKSLQIGASQWVKIKLAIFICCMRHVACRTYARNYPHPILLGQQRSVRQRFLDFPYFEFNESKDWKSLSECRVRRLRC